MKQILYLGNKLEKHGFSPTSVDTLTPWLEKEGFDIKAVSSIKNKVFRLIHMLVSVLRSGNKDLVVIDTYSTSNFWYAVLCGRLSGLLSIPYIFILHGGGLSSRFENSSDRILKIFRKARVNIVPSDFLKDNLEKVYLRNIFVIPNSIDLSIYNFKKRDSVQPKLLWVRAFDEVYNPEMALKVLETLLQEHPNSKLCMVGPEKDGSLRQLKNIAEDKKLPVEFKGKLTKKEWTVLSTEYDIFINTTGVDNTPVSLLEAMALGMPIVSTNVGGIPYLIEDGKNGLLVEPGNANEMAHSIKRLLYNSDLARSLSENGRAKVKNYDWAEVKQLWLELLG